MFRFKEGCRWDGKIWLYVIKSTVRYNLCRLVQTCMYICVVEVKRDYYGEQWWKDNYWNIFKNRKIVNIKSEYYKTMVTATIKFKDASSLKENYILNHFNLLGNLEPLFYVFHEATVKWHIWYTSHYPTALHQISPLITNNIKLCDRHYIFILFMRKAICVMQYRWFAEIWPT